MKGRTECEHMEKGRRLGGRQQQKSKEAITSDTRIDTHTQSARTVDTACRARDGETSQARQGTGEKG